MVGGYIGRLLRVDLTKGSISEESLPSEDVLRKYIGGIGLGLKILCDELPPDAKPLDPENRLILMTGPLTAAGVPGGSDTTVVTLNANTGYTVGTAHTHGFFAAFLKFAGYDGIIFQGASSTPVYLWVHDGEAELRDASALWGRDTHDTEDLIKDALRAEGWRRDISVAAIGPGGENLIHGAGIENDKHHIAAKGGGGVVMGSKRLKAIAVSGRGAVPLAHPKELFRVSEEWRKRPFPFIKPIGRMNFFAERGFYSVKNFLSPAWAAQGYHPAWLKATTDFKVSRVGCFSCPKACGYKVEIGYGPYRGRTVHLSPGGEGPEGAAGMTGMEEPGTIVYFHDKYNRLGLDTSPLGAAIGMAFECYERGILTKRDTDGLELRWGNAEALDKLLDKVVKREGFGQVLADGPAKAAERIGGDAPNRVVHMKGTGINMHDWRGAWGVMLAQTVAGCGPSWSGGYSNDFRVEPDIGVPQLSTPFTTEGKAKEVKGMQIRHNYDDSTGTCYFVALREVPNALHLLYEAMAAATGWEGFDMNEAFTVGERVINLQRLFNLRHGLTPANDLDVSPRLLEPPADGFAKGKTVAPYLKDMVLEYYELMGWDRETGKPLKKTLKRLGLEDMAKGV